MPGRRLEPLQGEVVGEGGGGGRAGRPRGRDPPGRQRRQCRRHGARLCAARCHLTKTTTTTTTIIETTEMSTLVQQAGWLGSRVVSVLDSGAEWPGFKSQPRRGRGQVAPGGAQTHTHVLGKLFTPTVPLFTKQRNW